MPMLNALLARQYVAYISIVGSVSDLVSSWGAIRLVYGTVMVALANMEAVPVPTNRVFTLSVRPPMAISETKRMSPANISGTDIHSRHATHGIMRKPI